MFRIIHPNRWFIWCLVIIFCVFVFIWWQISLYSSEQEASQVLSSSTIQIRETKTESSTPQQQGVSTEKTVSTQVTLTTIDICSPLVKDSSTLLFTDKNNKVWTVNYSNATFTNFGNVTKKVLPTTLQDWIKTLYRVGQPKAEICGAPGTITITGTLTGTTVFASHIELIGQG